MKKKQIVTLLLIATLGITNNASVVGAIENTSEVTTLEDDGEMNEANNSSNDYTENTDGNIVTTGDAVKEDVPGDTTEGDASEGSIAEDTLKEENVEDDVTTEEPDNTTSEDTEEAEENKPGWSEDGLYYRDENGELAKGITKIDDIFYNFDKETGMLLKRAGWIEKDDKKYFANEEGKLYRNQFISFGKTKYYMGDDGSTQKGIVKANDGNYYHMDETTGTLVRTAGWLERDGKRYFSNAEGKIYRNQFISFGNTRYYMGDDGSIQKGIVRANDGNYYHMDETTGTLVRTAGWLERDGKRYFSNAEGKLYRNQFISFGKTYYYCAEEAAIVQGQQYPVKGVLYTFDENGVMQITSGWGEYNGRKYYINPSTGFPYKGWITFGQTVYYADANGLLVNGWKKINGYSYYFYSSNYVMARNTTIDGKRIGQDGRVAQYADRMAVFSTVSTNNENGTYNMSRALKSFNQVVIQPGQTLSFFSVAGPCGKAQGYKQAGVVGGVGYGGGICQASTTLYGAVVRAGLTIVQRRNHSVPSTYVPIGQDAMVNYGSSDLKFRNDYDYPVKLVTYVSGRTLYAEVWGMQPDWYDYINVRSWSTGAKSAVAYRDYVKNGKAVKTEQLPSSYYR